MKTTLDHLPATKQEEILKIVRVIRQHKEVEMIILFGSYARGDWAEEYENDGIHFKYQSDFDLLAIVKNDSIFKQRRLEIEMMDKIEEITEIQTPVCIILHDIGFINQCLKKAQYFFSDIKKEGIVLYDTGQIILKEALQLSGQEKYHLAKKYFDQYFSKAKKLLRIFEFCLVNQDYCEAAFELHQATERLYHTLLLVFTNYKPKIHDLRILRRATNILDKRLSTVFPLKSAREKYLFRLLYTAYIEARYNEHYVITCDELRWLGERIKELEQITKILCQEKMQSYLSS